MSQIPAGAEGVAAFVFTYSAFSLICSALLLWLTIIHREGWSYVFLLCVSTGLSTIASMTQQMHVIIEYDVILREQFRRKTHATDSPELAIAGGSYGLDLGLYYFQYWSYNVQALLVMFWAGELAQSVYGFSNKPRTRHWLNKVNIAGKAISFILPAATILALRSPALQKDFFGFIALADLPLMISLALGSLLMVLISVRYIKTKKGFTNWSPPSGSTNTGGGTVTSTTGQTDFSSTQYSSTVGARQVKSPRRQGFHDRWLLVRFFVSFAILGVFEVTNILFQLQSIANLENDSKLTEPDTSVGRANTVFFLFLPGTTAGIFLFIVFGTTAGCRAKMRETFYPQCLKDRRRRKEEAAASGDIEYNYGGSSGGRVLDVYGPGGDSGKGRIVRSSSVTVTYTKSGGGGGDVLALENLSPSSQQHQQQGRKKSFKTADDLLLESDRDSSDNDSTSEIIIGAAVPATTAKPTAANTIHRGNNGSGSSSNRSNSLSRSRSNSSNSTAGGGGGRLTYGSLNKPLPVPSADTPMSRIAHFQSLTRPAPARMRTNTGGAGGSSSAAAMIPEAADAEEEERRVMDRHFQEHQRRQPPLRVNNNSNNNNKNTTVTAATSGQQQPVLGEEYYGSSPEQSDDSGPVLPIMPAGARRA